MPYRMFFERVHRLIKTSRSRRIRCSSAPYDHGYAFGFRPGGEDAWLKAGLRLLAKAQALETGFLLQAAWRSALAATTMLVSAGMTSAH